MNKDLAEVNWWTTSLRYEPGMIKREDADSHREVPAMGAGEDIAMARRNGSKDDHAVRHIEETLKRDYGSAHPKARIEVKRYNSVSVRVRIIDADFSGLSRAERDTLIWEILESLPEETRSEVSLLLLFTPQEAKTSLMNLEFDDPIPSSL